MASILLIVKHHQQEQLDAREMVRIALETSTSPLTDDGPKGATAGGDERKLRGIPAIGRGVAGAIAGTSPHNVR